MKDEHEPIIHVWITQYALTQGVFETNAKHCLKLSDKMISVVHHNGFGNDCYHKPHWHKTKEEADARVRVMIYKKIKSLKKSLAKMEELREKYSRVPA